MIIYENDNKTENIINQLLNIWEQSVRAIHLFLSGEEIE